MDIREIKEKLGQYGLLCQLYAEASCELTRRSKLSQEEAIRACKVYEPYIQDILHKANAAIAIFVMEKELRGLKGRGHFPVPTITLHGTKVDNPHHMNKFLEEVDGEIVNIITTVRKSDRDYAKEKERARMIDQQTQASRITHKPE